jgi:hypothetical protein
MKKRRGANMRWERGWLGIAWCVERGKTAVD